MSLADLKTITMRFENTANFVIKLLLLEGVGFEVVWWRQDPNTNTRWNRQNGSGVTRDLAKAEAEYDTRFRLICIAEAALALGLTPFEKEK